MGRFLGSHTGDELDRPDLNKCPDCDCFFADDYCPLCGKLCPEEMRAGNRKAVKKQKERNSNAGRVTFIAWYHSWWFIILSFFLFSPLVALVLLLTSPHKKSHKITAAVLIGVWIIVIPIVLSFIYPLIFNLTSEPLVDKSMQIGDYEKSALSITPEEYYRLPESYYGKDVITELKVISKLYAYDSSTSDVFGYSTVTYFLCKDPNNENIEILVRDCLIEGYRNPLPNDVIKVYGRAAGEIYITTTSNQSYDLPCINMACVEITK